MVKSITMNLIDHHSQDLDRQLSNLLPEILGLTQEETTLTSEYKFSDFEEEEEEVQDYYSQQTDEHKIIPVSEQFISSCPPKSKRISKNHKRIETQQVDSTQISLNSSQSFSQSFKRPRKTRAKKPQYPTKNFLPNFKVPHLNFIKKYYPNCMIEFPEIAKIQKKDGISLKDYEYLYRIPQLKPIFRMMFKKRILYRQLLLSRSDVITKLIHQGKLQVFQKAFETENFERINY